MTYKSTLSVVVAIISAVVLLSASTVSAAACPEICSASVVYGTGPAPKYANCICRGPGAEDDCGCGDCYLLSGNKVVGQATCTSQHTDCSACITPAPATPKPSPSPKTSAPGIPASQTDAPSGVSDGQTPTESPKPLLTPSPVVPVSPTPAPSGAPPAFDSSSSPPPSSSSTPSSAVTSNAPPAGNVTPEPLPEIVHSHNATEEPTSSSSSPVPVMAPSPGGHHASTGKPSALTGSRHSDKASSASSASSKDSATSNSSGSSKTGMKTWQIVLIICSCCVVFAVAVVAILSCYCKARQRLDENEGADDDASFYITNQYRVGDAPYGMNNGSMVMSGHRNSFGGGPSSRPSSVKSLNFGEVSYNNKQQPPRRPSSVKGVSYVESSHNYGGGTDGMRTDQIHRPTRLSLGNASDAGSLFAFSTMQGQSQRQPRLSMGNANDASAILVRPHGPPMSQSSREFTASSKSIAVEL